MDHGNIMKKPKLDSEIETSLVGRILDSGILVMDYDPSNGRFNYIQPPRYNVYECACKLTGVNRLFNGPKISDEALESEYCDSTRDWLVQECLIESKRDLQTLRYSWKLTEHGVDFFYIYTRLLTKKKWRRSQHWNRVLLIILTMGFYAFYKVAEWAITATKEKKQGKKRRRRRR